MRYSYTYNNIAPNENLLFSENKTIAKKQNNILLYEKANHLGNVRVVISDMKLWVDLDTDDIPDGGEFSADASAYNNYYAYHSIQPLRSWNTTDYRYGGANGKEKDDEISGAGNSYTSENWQYSPRTGWRWNQDQVVKAGRSPYACYGDNPIIYIDPDGKDIVLSTTLTPGQKSQLNATFVYLSVKSTIFSTVFKELSGAKEEYHIGNPLDAKSSLGATKGVFYPTNNNSVYAAVTGKLFEGHIDLNKSEPIHYNNELFRSVISEEVFHAAQDRFQRETGKGVYSTKLSKEVEAKVFKAYSGTFSKDETEISTFAKDNAVSSYFNALRSGDKEKIGKTEGAFRAQVGKFAKSITASGHAYSDLGNETPKYNNETPLFDKLTKKDGKKN